MIRKKAECSIDYREHMRDGDGTVQITNFINSPEELNGKGRLFSHMTLKPGTSIGYHVHETDSELFYILCGTAEYDDNGTMVELLPGDVALCPAGTGHGIACKGDETLEFVALILFK